MRKKNPKNGGCLAAKRKRSNSSTSFGNESYKKPSQVFKPWEV